MKGWSININLPEKKGTVDPFPTKRSHPISMSLPFIWQNKDLFLWKLLTKIGLFMFINPLYANSNHCEKPRLAWAKRRRRSVSDENDRIIGFGSSESRVASSNNNKQKIRTWQDEKETVEKYIRLTSSYCQMGLLHYQCNRGCGIFRLIVGNDK